MFWVATPLTFSLKFMSSQFLIHFQTRYSKNEAKGEFCCTVFPVLLFDEITKANSLVALVFRELPNTSLSDQGAANWDPQW